MTAQEGEALALDEIVRTRFAVVFLQLRLVIEKVELRGRADHVKIDHALRPRSKVRRPCREGIACPRWTRGKKAVSEQRAERHRAEAQPGSPQERAAGDVLAVFIERVHASAFGNHFV